MIDWDGEGRMWVVEMPGYMPDINADRRARADRQDRRARRHEQRRPHGQAHGVSGRPRPGALAQGARSRRARRGAAEPLAVPGHRTAIFAPIARSSSPNQYGRREGNVEHNANSLLWALDNNIYTSEIDIDLRLKNGKFEVRKTLSRGQWGITQDDAGRIFRNTNESALHVDLVPARYFIRHPNLLRTRGSYESLNGQNGELNDVWPIRPTRGVNRGYQIRHSARPTARSRNSPRCARRWCIAAIACPPSSTATSSSSIRPSTSSAGSFSATAPTARSRDEGVSRRARRVSRLDRRALPPRQSVARARRHALRRRHVSRHHPAQGIHDRVPARLRR